MIATACTANASFSSIRSISLSDQPVFFRSFRIASTGAIITSFGSMPEVACATIRANGSTPSDLARSAEVTTNAEAPLGMPEVFDDQLAVTYNLMHLAFQGDISRVFTFMIGHEASDRGYAHIGIPETHHSISHHGNEAEKLAKYAKIGTYQIVKFAEFLDKLKATKDGDGTLLDHATMMYGAGIGECNAHDPRNIPVLLAGGGAGTIKGGRHIRYPKETPLANLHLTLLDNFGVKRDRIGDSTGRLAIA